MNQRRNLIRILDDPGRLLSAEDPAVRRIAVSATHRHPELLPQVVAMLTSDVEASVRRECAEALGRSDATAVPALERAVRDSSPEVREAATNALGELESNGSVALLIAVAEDTAEDRMVREAAVAALGAIGDERARPVLLSLISSAPPQIRRRCVPALSIFDGDDIEAALVAAAGDRNPMVREAAEMVVGRPRS